MNNLTTHMAELRRILANIENKNINEGAVGETGEQFVKRLVGKSGKELVKELGPRVEIATVIRRPKVDFNTKKPTGEFTEREIKEVWEHMPGTELYSIKTVNGVEPKQMRTRTADVIKTEVETAAKEGRIVKSTSVNAGKDVADPVVRDPGAEAIENAEKLSIPELEKKIASGQGTVQQQKAYADELAKKKAAAPPAEPPKDNKFDTAEVARATAKKMTPEQLERAIKNTDISPVTRKEYEKELATRTKTEPTTGGEVLVKKEIEREKAAAKTALDDGAVTIKELENASGGAAKKINEKPSEHLDRVLKDDPAYKGAWEGMEGTEKEVGFWKRLGRKAKVGGLISIPVLLAAGGAYVAMKDKTLPEPEEEVLADPTADVDGTEVTDAEVAAAEEAAKKAKEEAAKKAKETDTATDVKGPEGKTDVEKNAEKNQAPSVTSTEPPAVANAVANKPTAEQAAELAKLKAQIDALVAELAKSNDPAIQKRLAAVRAKLGQTNQAPSVTSTEQGGWKNIGNNYRRWYGPDGYDEKGTFVTRGTLDNIPYDAGQVDKWSKMSNQEKDAYLRKAERAGKLK